MKGFHFTRFREDEGGKSRFEVLLDLFMQLLLYTNGDFNEALNWMNHLDKEYELTDEEYGMGDFIEELKEKGYIKEDPVTGTIQISSKSEQTIRKRSLEEIFGKLKKSKTGHHGTFKPGRGDEINPETRPYSFGDTLEQIDFTDSIRQAQINHGIDSFQLHEDDL